MLGSYQPEVPKPNHIPRGMHRPSEPLNEGHSMCYFRHIGLHDQQETLGVTDELFVNDVTRVKLEHRNKLSELLRKFSSGFSMKT
ncbi:hypothetical protein TNCV_4174551 [Trichonephila clavipes]|nr:hypothetical protein TNCV_4174551 [Trichonephila clavipes]